MSVNTKTIRVLLLESSEWRQIDLYRVLTQDPLIQIVAQVETGKEIFQKVAEVQPEIILMDVRLPDGCGLKACRRIVALYPDTRVLFLSSVEDDESH